MRYFFILLVLLAHVSYSQFAFVLDKDGFSNVRLEGHSGSRVMDTLHNGHLVSCFETRDGWTNIEFATKGKDGLTGYIHRDRLKLISDFETIPAEAGTQYIFARDSIKVIMSIRPFIKSEYRITYNKNYPENIKTINGKRYWGTDGFIPKKAYKSIRVLLRDQEIKLPPAAIDDLFEPTPWNSMVNYDRGHDILYIQAMNSDGAGAYSVIWTIERGVYTGRFVAYID